jgi:hypothetical protein
VGVSTGGWLSSWEPVPVRQLYRRDRQRVSDTERSTGPTVRILDADLSAAFDNTGHAALIDRLGALPTRELIKGWLKAGVTEGGFVKNRSEEVHSVDRKLHFVGSIPLKISRPDSDALLWPVERARDSGITAVPRDLDPNWIVDYLRSRVDQREAFEVVLSGEYGVDDYEDIRAYRVRRGVELRPDHVAMGRIERINEVVETYRELQRERSELAGVRLQISQPAPLDLVLFVEVGGLAVAPGLPWSKVLRHPMPLTRALRHLPVYEQAVSQEIEPLAAAHRDMLTWQIETPLCTLAMVKAATVPGLQAAMAPLLSMHLASMFARMAALGAHATLHLCYGNYTHKALLHPKDLSPLVRLLNGLGARLDKLGLTRPMVHVPCAYGAEAAPLRPEFYQPLTRLDGGWTELVAGVAAVGAQDATTALELFERAAGRKAVAVAAACGLGRQSDAEADAVVHAMRAAAGSQ